VRELVGDLIAEGVEAVVPLTIRETVLALQEILSEGKEETTVAKVAKRLNLDKSPASRRIKVAIQRGYIINLETRKYSPARLVLGDPLPEEMEILPTSDKLSGCAVASEMGGIHTLLPPEETEGIDILEGEIG